MDGIIPLGMPVIIVGALWEVSVHLQRQELLRCLQSAGQSFCQPYFKVSGYLVFIACSCEQRGSAALVCLCPCIQLRADSAPDAGFG